MDRWEGPATLEWWANESLCLGRFGVRVTVCVTGDDWAFGATLAPPLSREAREAFDLLMQDPLWTLRFEGEGAVGVEVTAGVGGRLAVGVRGDAGA